MQKKYPVAWGRVTSPREKKGCLRSPCHQYTDQVLGWLTNRKPFDLLLSTAVTVIFPVAAS